MWSLFRARDRIRLKTLWLNIPGLGRDIKPELVAKKEKGRSAACYTGANVHVFYRNDREILHRVGKEAKRKTRSGTSRNDVTMTSVMSDEIGMTRITRDVASEIKER